MVYLAYNRHKTNTMDERMTAMRKTKIICTLGPSTDSDEKIEELIRAGMDVARFNFSHQTYPEHLERFRRLLRIREKLRAPVAALLDTKGPEIRLGMLEGGKALLEDGAEFILTTRELVGNSKIASISYKGLPGDVKAGDRILIDDGLIALKLTAVKGEDLICTVINGGPISNRKGINVPNVALSMPFLSEQDQEDILFGIRTGFDFVAASFTRTAEDVRAIRQLLDENGGEHIRIIAKIENAQGVENINGIIEAADGIMVARGDMGVEISFENIPVLQKQLITKAYNAGKQVITATQMLDSMMKNPRPTRAEITDVANAIYDGTSAIMLSGETAAGAYPIEAVKTMVAIAERTEADIDYEERFRARATGYNTDVTNAISHATVTTALDLKAKCIITVTKYGKTAKMISKYRPVCPIIACSPHGFTVRQLNLSWGVLPILGDEKTSTDALFAEAYNQAEAHGYIQKGDLVVTTAGVPLGISGTTNLLRVDTIGDPV